jgi:hypothetical protein
LSLSYDPRSRIRKKSIPDLGFRVKKTSDPGSGTPTLSGSVVAEEGGGGVVGGVRFIGGFNWYSIGIKRTMIDTGSEKNTFVIFAEC